MKQVKRMTDVLDARELLAILHRNPPEFTSRLLAYAAALEKAMNKKGE